MPPTPRTSGVLMETSALQALVGPLVVADRQHALTDLREALADLKGEAAGKGRLQSGFFVADMRRLCERYVNRRTEEILSAYHSVLSTRQVDPASQVQSILKVMQTDLADDVEAIEQVFQSNLHRNHLPVRNAMSEAAARSNDVVKAKGPMLVILHSRRVQQEGFPKVPEKAYDSDEILELKPNLWGFGINLRALGRRLRRRWSKSAAD